MKLLICCILLSFSLPGFAKGDPKAGQNKALVCSACHGADGHSTNPQWPNLAGQYASYLVQQLHYYQSGDKRSSPIMSPLVTNLNQQDMEDLAEFYAQKPLPPSPPAKTPMPRADQLYRQGDLDLHIPACITCHGPDGRGAEQAGFPMISHQQPEYIIQQLQAFKAGTRSTDPLKIMRTICEKLTPEDMQALAEYITHLGAAQK
ncbi:MAG: c-type cytochrome [Legionellales bacterium]|nr:c-type cytochrome [Legionellales bacterium]